MASNGTPDEVAPAYGASDHYDASYFEWQNSNIGVKAKFKLQRFGPYIKATDTVLDFGCAGGSMLSVLPGTRKIGVELNDVAREAAARDHGIEVYKSLDDAPDGVADVIVSNHALEHMASPHTALQQLRSKLRPGGRLVIVLPIDDWRACRTWDPDDINKHLYTWSPLNLGNLLVEAGWQPQEVRVIRRTLMRGYVALSRWPRLADAASFVASVLRHRLEVLATATVADPG